MMFFSLNDEHDFYLNIEKHEKHEWTFLKHTQIHMNVSIQPPR